MSYLDARAQYRRAQEGVLPDLSDAHQIVLVTLRELHKSLLVLSAAQAEQRRLPSASISKALTAVYILQSSLDFEKGGEIADNLFRVYEFVRLQLLAAFQRNPETKLQAASTYVEEILSAWETMPRQA